MIESLDKIKREARELAIRLRGRIPDRGPDFFIAGASRSGSTYLHFLLSHHPDIFMPRTKELHYFDTEERYRPDLKGYFTKFDGYNGELLIGEVTPSYLLKGGYFDKSKRLRFGSAESSIQRIHRHLPNAKIVITVRDPLTRIVSLHSKLWLQGKCANTLKEEVELELRGLSECGLLFMNRYEIHISEVLKFFPREAVHIMVFEEWKENRTEHANRLARFLGVDELTTWPDPAEGRNEAERYRTANSASVSSKPSALDPATREIVLRETRDGRRYLEELIARPLAWQS